MVAALTTVDMARHKRVKMVLMKDWRGGRVQVLVARRADSFFMTSLAKGL
jgi:hypothetical protein